MEGQVLSWLKLTGKFTWGQLSSHWDRIAINTMQCYHNCKAGLSMDHGRVNHEASIKLTVHQSVSFKPEIIPHILEGYLRIKPF